MRAKLSILSFTMPLTLPYIFETLIGGSFQMLKRWILEGKPTPLKRWGNGLCCKKFSARVTCVHPRYETM